MLGTTPPFGRCPRYCLKINKQFPENLAFFGSFLRKIVDFPLYYTYLAATLLVTNKIAWN